MRTTGEGRGKFPNRPTLSVSRYRSLNVVYIFGWYSAFTVHVRFSSVHYLLSFFIFLYKYFCKYNKKKRKEGNAQLFSEGRQKEEKGKKNESKQ